MKKNPISVLRNENGTVLLYVLVISLIVVGIFTSTMIQNQNSERQIYQARFRNQLDAFETRWQTLLGQPSTYTGCQFNVANSCKLDTNVTNKYLQLPLIGGGCLKPSSRDQSTAGLGTGVKLPTCDLTCGFCASVTLDPADGSIAHLVVNPVGTSLRPVQVNIQIPYDVLQVQTISCPDQDGTKPRFAGLDAKGNAICLPLYKPKCQYPGIQYAYGVDAGTGAILCKNIPNIKISCPDSKYMSVFGWSTVALGDGCTSRLWPYVFSYYDDPKP